MIVLGIETSCDETAAAVVERLRTAAVGSCPTSYFRSLPIMWRSAAVEPEITAAFHVRSLNVLDG